MCFIGSQDRTACEHPSARVVFWLWRASVLSVKSNQCSKSCDQSCSCCSRKRARVRLPDLAFFFRTIFFRLDVCNANNPVCTCTHALSITQPTQGTPTQAIHGHCKPLTSTQTTPCITRDPILCRLPRVSRPIKPTQGPPPRHHKALKSTPMSTKATPAHMQTQGAVGQWKDGHPAQARVRFLH